MRDVPAHLRSDLDAELSRLRDLTKRHQPVRASEVHPSQGWEKDLAVWITDHVGTMRCAGLFLGIGVGSLVGLATNNSILAGVCGSVSSYVLQLVLLPVILVGQQVQQAHGDALAQQTWESSQRSGAELEAMHARLESIEARLIVLAGPKVVSAGD